MMSEYYVQLVKTYAQNIEPLIEEVIHSLCHGCYDNHPSQKQHNVCLMMEDEERIAVCLDRYSKMIDEKKFAGKRVERQTRRGEQI